MLSRVLMPVPERQWREPSEAQSKDQFGNQNCTRFRLTARLNDGFVRWRGWFDSRDDADAFLFALAMQIIDGTPVPVEMWRLPSPWWHPDIGEGLTYDFATLTFLTSPTGSNQTFTSPADWGNSQNTVETLGGGGQGPSTGNITASGGGGGEYRTLGALGANFTFAAPGITTATYQIGAVNGGQSWWNASTFGASTLGSNGGSAGTTSAGASASGGAGGTGGVGGTGNAGGRGGNVSGNTHSSASGGGGAGGGIGAGNNGADITNPGGNTSGNGGTGDAGSGGAGGVGAGTGGGLGTEWDGTHGSGGGGAGNSGGGSGSGGNYGGGGGSNTGLGGVGTGSSGIIVLTYTPFKRGAFIAFF